MYVYIYDTALLLDTSKQRNKTEIFSATTLLTADKRSASLELSPFFQLVIGRATQSALLNRQ